jgi:SAM-dependent methyltransferase
MSLNNLESVFSPEEYLYFYSDVLTPKRLEAEINFLKKFTDLAHPKYILDLACGFGRHANALAKLGHTVTGIDYSEGFLKIAREDASKIGVKVNYIHADMRNINYQAVYDRVYCLFTAIGYFSDEENEELFSRIFHALKPGGIFCFDSHNRDNFHSYFKPQMKVEKSGNFMSDEISFDPASGRSRTKRTTLFNNLEKTTEFEIRLYSPTELKKILTNIGYSNLHFYDNWKGNPISPEGKRMIITATR